MIERVFFWQPPLFTRTLRLLQRRVLLAFRLWVIFSAEEWYGCYNEMMLCRMECSQEVQ